MSRTPFPRAATALAACALLPLAHAPARAASTPYATIHTFGAYQDGINPNYNATLTLASDGNFYGATYSGGTNNGGTVYKLTPAGAVTTLHSFTNFGTPRDGYTPRGRVLEGADGYLYGVCESGGDNSGGTLYKVKKDGTSFKPLYQFTSAGYTPRSGVAQGSDGYLYGTTYNGSGTDGTIYKIKTDGTGFALVHAFASNGGDGGSLYFPPVLSGTTLYGPTNAGGTGNLGTIYKVKTDGTGFTILHNQTASTDNGYNLAGLILGSDGKLYGEARSGPGPSYGTVFGMKTDGSGYTVLHTFTAGADGAYPNGTPLQDSTGTLYGTADQGGLNYGTVWSVKTSGGSYKNLYSFKADGTEGTGDAPGVTVGPDGRLYGVRHTGGVANDGTVFSLTTGGGSFKVAYNYGNGFVDGTRPYYGSLVIGPGSDWYGTTYQGGAGSYGTVYSMSTSGKVAILHAFTDNATLEDGGYPYGGLLTGPNSTLLGTTYYGGTYNAGTVFSVGATGTGFATTLSFGAAAGANLPSGLVRGPGGILYGTSYNGGRYNNGCVYRIGTDGFESVIYSFHNTADGRYPNGNLLAGTDGALYGTTLNGGAGAFGTVYKVTPGGAYTLVHAFKIDGTEGAYPYSGVTQDASGNLYGTTYQRGQFNYGTVYTVKMSGSSFKTMHSFSSQNEGGYPFAGLLLATDGRLYGTTTSYGSVNGGSNNAGGTLYRINTSGGSFTALHTFDPTKEGYTPYSAPAEGKDGNLYGTTYNGGVPPYPGTNMYGSAYKLSMLLPLVSSFSPTSAKKGAAVTLAGVNFTGATAVTFGTGLTNALTVNSDTKITVTVPANATSGPITVTTPKGTGASASSFTVTP